MLTKSDIEFIKKSRKEVIHNRTNSVEIIHRIKGEKNHFTGDYEYSEESEVVEATWRLWTSQSPGSNDVSYVNGVRVESGDAIAEFELDVFLDDVRRVTHLDSGHEYDIQARDKIGLGEINRHYVLLRRVV